MRNSQLRSISKNQGTSLRNRLIKLAPELILMGLPKPKDVGETIFHLSHTHFFHICMGIGEGTNNYVELITLQHLIHFSILKHCRHIQIFGDPKIVLNWCNNTATCHAYTLRTIMDDIAFLKKHFNHVSCTHIYREHNESADKLSKEATHRSRGEWLITEHILERTYQYFHRQYTNQELQWADST